VTINTFYRAPGDLVDSTAETGLQDAIEAETLAIGTGNLRTEALNRAHFQTTYGDITTFPDEDVFVAGTFASSTYVPIMNPLEIQETIQPGWVVRFQWSLLVTGFERAGNLGEYAFCLKTSATSILGPYVQQSPDYWYSAMSYPRDGPSTATYWPMINRRHTMSYTMVRPTAFTLKYAQVEVKIASPWSITIGNANVFVFIQRH